MTSTLDRHQAAVSGKDRRGARPLALAALALGAGLALNTVLGPLLTDTIRYPFSETLRNQTIGLEAVTLVLVTPLCIVSAALIWRGRSAGPVIALGPATYAAYMMLQYLVGPGYLHYPRVLPLHLGLFVLSGVVAVGSWSTVDAATLPVMTTRSVRRQANVMLVLAGFIISRYLPAIAGSWNQAAIGPEFVREPGMFWSILTLDLGIVVPATVYAAVALRHGSPAAAKAVYAVLGWFALVPPSVAAMALVMVLNHDPNGSAGQVALFALATAVFWAFAYRVFRPLLTTSEQRTRR
jgi:hypothetical protein